MNVLETQWWTLALPPEWWAEAEGDSILVGDRDEVGCIEISTIVRETGEFSAGEVADIARAEAEVEMDWSAVSLGDFSGVAGAFEEEGDAVREWYVAAGPMLLYITYSCASDNRGMDDAAVDQILDTLMLVDEAASD